MVSMNVVHLSNMSSFLCKGMGTSFEAHTVAQHTHTKTKRRLLLKIGLSRRRLPWCVLPNMRRATPFWLSVLEARPSNWPDQVAACCFKVLCDWHLANPVDEKLKRRRGATELILWYGRMVGLSRRMKIPSLFK